MRRFGTTSNNLEDKNIKYATAFSSEQFMYKITISQIGYLNFKILIDKPYYNDLKFSVITTAPIKPSAMEFLSPKRQGDILIFPNPSFSNITLLAGENNQDNIILNLYRLDGTLCKVINLNFENPAFSVEDLENGIYILKFTYKTIDYSLKLVKCQAN